MPTKTASNPNVHAVEFISGDSGRTYQIARVMKRNKPTVACTCPGFSRYLRCKHATSVIESGKMPKGEKFVLDLDKFNNRLNNKKENTVSRKIVVRKSSKSSGRVITCSVCGGEGHNARTCDSNKRRHAAPATKRTSASQSKFRVGGRALALGKPVNIKVEGERTMRKSVILSAHPSQQGVVMVKTGGRGRPSNVPVAPIQKFRVL